MKNSALIKTKLLYTLQETSSWFTPDIEYFIWYGTLLGYHRDLDIIHNDDDVDFYVNIKHRDNLLDIIHQKTSGIDPWQISINEDCFLKIKKQSRCKSKWGHVDYYFYDNQEINRVVYEKKVLSRLAKDGAILVDNPGVPQHYIYPIKNIEFRGIKVSVPNEPGKCSRFIYGDNYMTPLPKRKKLYQQYPTLRKDDIQN